MSKITIDANSAVSKIAYKLSEVIPVYPITPSTPMAEMATAKASLKEKNLFGKEVTTIEMQSEAGVAGALHGSLLGGALSSTFTCSQGLLLMIPDMYKMAGEGLPAVIHVSARAVSSHALSIFGDHSDVMGVRQTGFSLLCSNNPQEAQDMALIAHTCAVKYDMPMLHFFDGFRTSHEIQKIEELSDNQIKKMFPSLSQIKIKKQPLSPNNPRMYGTAQNPDVFFQGKEAGQGRYQDFSKNLEKEFEKFFSITGRKYHSFDYFGKPDAKNVIVSMGSSCETIKETIRSLNSETALIAVRLYRPFDEENFLKALPKTIKNICVLDRTKESGANSPLLLDVRSAIQKSGLKIKVIGGRYGLGGKEFSPACAKAVIDNLNGAKKDDFTVGIQDDLFNSSLPCGEFHNSLNQTEIKIYGLGSDGSVSASKSLIKILGKNKTENVQGYFEYDSKKSGSLTISHLRLSKDKIESTYLIDTPNIVSINNFSFVHRYNCLQGLKEKGLVLINSIFNSDEIDKVLPLPYKKQLKEKNAKLFLINAQKIARENGLNEKINIIMLAGLFKCTNLLKSTDAKHAIQAEIEKNFKQKGVEVVNKNLSAMNSAFNAIEEVDLNKLSLTETGKTEKKSSFSSEIMNKVQRLEGNSLPVSMFSDNGSIPTDTAKHEKRGIAVESPIWLPENCVQCGQCVLACPHGALRAILVDENDQPIDENMPFANAIGLKGMKYRIQISPEDCTGCGVCAENCPAIKKALVMAIASKNLEKERKNYEKSLKINSKQAFSTDHPKGLQFKPSYFNFPGACAGCGETPYIKLASMLFGEKMIVANATGCSSIYSGSFPYCPFSKNEKGQGPAWASSLFEDNAEFGLGIKLAGKYSNQEKASVWIIGGDGWADDIGFGGLDHVLQSKENVNILVLDNENYSNTGGQSSKSTPLGTYTKFSESGKETKKKNLGLIAMTYQNAYVAQVSIGADMSQCIKAFKEAEAFDGPSLIIAYSTCVNHGFNMKNTMKEMKKAVECGYWNLFRYNPNTGLEIDYMPQVNIPSFMKGERRFTALKEMFPQKANDLEKKHNDQSKQNLEILKRMAKKD